MHHVVQPREPVRPVAYDVKEVFVYAAIRANMPQMIFDLGKQVALAICSSDIKGRFHRTRGIPICRGRNLSSQKGSHDRRRVCELINHPEREPEKVGLTLPPFLRIAQVVIEVPFAGHESLPDLQYGFCAISTKSPTGSSEIDSDSVLGTREHSFIVDKKRQDVATKSP